MPDRNPHDNAQAKVGWSALKTKLLFHDGVFTTLEKPSWGRHLFDAYFNLDRRLFALGYRFPHTLKPTCSSLFLSSLSASTGPPQPIEVCLGFPQKKKECCCTILINRRRIIL